MRVNLKGIHSVKMLLASGKTEVYHYAWRGGPAIQAKPGTQLRLRSHGVDRDQQAAPIEVAGEEHVVAGGDP